MNQQILPFKAAFLKPWVATQMWVAKTMRMGRDPNVSRQEYADGSRKLVNYRT